jgi:hypothetical protein
MAVLHIPTGNDPYSVQRTDLEGRSYILQFDWSTREGCWYLSIYDVSSEPLATGIKMVCDWPLTYRLPNPALPPGDLLVISKTADDSPPGLEDLAEGGRCELTYVTSDHAYPADVIAAGTGEE